MARAGTVRELRDSGYRTKSVKQELRDNLIARLKRGERIIDLGAGNGVVPLILAGWEPAGVAIVAATAVTVTTFLLTEGARAQTVAV